MKGTISDDEAVLRHFCYQIQLACGCSSSTNNKERPLISTNTWRVSATAIVFMQRFYINNSLLCHDPRITMLACILLAGKVEESHVSMRELFKLHPKCPLESVLEAELKLMQGINYQLKVYHPQSMLSTLIVDLKRSYAASAATPKGSNTDRESDGKTAAAAAITAELSEKSKDWLSESERAADLLQLTVACLCYSPLEVAVAALSLTHPQNMPLTLQAYLLYRFGPTAADLLSNCDAIMSLFPAARACVVGEEQATVGSTMTRLRLSSRWGAVQREAKRRRDDD